ncbi:hypothetical protein MXB_2089 [Myxobolus squamalis]|nr:hypothetical protein MXB_2089 [Myxobolus squamalis]
MLSLALFFLISLNSLDQISIKQKSLDSKWLDYKLEYKLEFLESEEKIRKDIFLKNSAFIMNSNSQNKSFTLKMNDFGHLDRNEREKRLMSHPGKRIHGEKTISFARKQIALELDWRRARVVSRVKNQLKCGSCYAFSAVGAIESQFAIYTGVLPDLSEQEIVDCSWKYSNLGCYGGNPVRVYNYLIENGISTSVAYPYRGRNYQCNRNNPGSAYKLAGYKILEEGDEDNLLKALYWIGPISIAIAAGSDEYTFYSSGIIDFPSCVSKNMNHAVLAVGYSLHKRPYLLVKNSWGKNWGIDGYFKIALFRNNMCGISSFATFPIPKI